MRILLVEDEASLAQAVLEHLQAEHHLTDWFATLDEARAAILTLDYDMVLLDLKLPDGDGLDLLQTLRRQPAYTPVIIMTARDKVSDRIKGLNLGADDYVIKPFDLNELSARINTVARRRLDNASNTIRHGDLEFSLAEHRVHRGGAPVPLTATEWSLMECLLRRSGAVVSKTVLEEALYAFGKEVESNSIEAHISRLRTKLGRDSIVTHRGLGYSIEK
ncbi:MAG: response regulator transcription factor [Rhodobacteraceae bacterium]|nr:response regulator transcription factor [Paracoccaceae bacterium]